MSGQRSHRHMIYRPRRRCRHGNPLWKTNRSSPKAHPSNRSIHPKRLPPFHRSRLFRKRPRSRRSARRSRLAANRPHLSSHQHRRKLHQRSSYQPSVKSRNQTPHRGNGPRAALISGREIQSKSAHQRHSQKRLHRKPRQNAHGKQLHRTHRERCLKRATTARPEQPPQPRKSWPKPRQRPSRS